MTDIEIASHYYRFREGPRALLQIISLFKEQIAQLKKKRVFAWIFFFLFAGISYGLNRYTLENTILFGDTLYPLIIFGIVSYLFFYIMCKICSSNRAVNPSSFSKSRAFNFLPIIIFSGIFFFAAGKDLLGAVPNFLAILPNPIQTPFEGLVVLLSIFFPVATVSQFFTARRYKDLIPGDFENVFTHEILENILREIPADQKCTLVINPFPSAWSQQTVQPGKQRVAKEATFDLILKLACPLGLDRSFSLNIIHRISQKGRRKHKGYKHKVKISYKIASSSMQKISNGQLAERFSKVMKSTDIQSIEPTENRYGFRTPPYNEGDFEFTSKGGVVGISEVFSDVKIFSPHLAAKDLIHPSLILGRVKALSQAVEL